MLRFITSPRYLSFRASAFISSLFLLAACQAGEVAKGGGVSGDAGKGPSSVVDPSQGLSFVALPRSLPVPSQENPSSQERSARAGSHPRSRAKDTFFLAIHPRELEQTFFLSSFLQSAMPHMTPRSLGTRVVQMRRQNSKLYFFDVDRRKQHQSDVTPEVVVEAFDLVKELDGRPIPRHLRHYLIIDPAEGRNQYSLVSDYFSGDHAYGQFNVDLSFSQAFRSIEDGLTFEKVLTGRFDHPVVKWPVNDNDFRFTATLGLSLRRYREDPQFISRTMPEVPMYFASKPLLIPDSGGQFEQKVMHWAIYPGMKPIRWELSSWLQTISQYPGLENFDMLSAVRRAADSWNRVFGFPVFEIALSTPETRIGHNDRNVIYFDRVPSNADSYADWRYNPNTGEMRGASIYIAGSEWLPELEKLLQKNESPEQAPQEQRGYAQTASFSSEGRKIRGPGAAAAFESGVHMRWGDHLPGRPGQLGRPCALDFSRFMTDLLRSEAPALADLSPEQRIEKGITFTVAHELGHTLGLRHNFMGSLGHLSNSVMEYLRPEDIVAVVDHLPLPYDVQALHYLYGLRNEVPAFPFCTDEGLSEHADCTTFDRGPQPLDDALHLLYSFAISLPIERAAEWNAAGREYFFLNSRNWIRYIRSGTPEQGLRATAALHSSFGVPVYTDWAADPSKAAVADAMFRLSMQRLFDLKSLGALGQKDVMRNRPRHDDVIRALIFQMREVLVNRDGIRSMRSRRSMVALLKKAQHAAGRIALIEAQQELRERVQEPGWSPEQRTELQDLLVHLENALDPYFDDSRGSTEPELGFGLASASAAQTVKKSSAAPGITLSR